MDIWVERQRKFCYFAIFWSTLTEGVRIFVAACIKFLSNKGGENVPLLFGPSLHGTVENDLLKLDYI